MAPNGEPSFPVRTRLDFALSSFVKFSEADSAAAMVAASDGRRRKDEDEGEGEEEQEEEGIWLDGRRIYAVM